MTTMAFFSHTSTCRFCFPRHQTITNRASFFSIVLPVIFLAGFHFIFARCALGAFCNLILQKSAPALTHCQSMSRFWSAARSTRLPEEKVLPSTITIVWREKEPPRCSLCLLNYEKHCFCSFSLEFTALSADVGPQLTIPDPPACPGVVYRSIMSVRPPVRPQFSRGRAPGGVCVHFLLHSVFSSPCSRPPTVFLIHPDWFFAAILLTIDLANSETVADPSAMQKWEVMVRSMGKREHGRKLQNRAKWPRSRQQVG